jgi:UDP-3-O-[3-hydroxymyristoyl] N-acetylglucosamine deacetylase
MLVRPQRTLKKEVSYCGVGIHTGKEVVMRLCPAPPHSGIVFQRVDLAGAPKIPAAIEYVQDTARSTTIGIGSYSVQTVEHLLAALSACQIDNLCVQINEGEPPIGDGSARLFVELIEEAGLEEQEAVTMLPLLKQPVYFSQGQTHLVALPAEEFRISYTLHYPNTPLIRSQYLSLQITPETFKEEIANCRTFALYEEITYLKEQGLIRGGSLENAIVIKGDAVFNEGGLRHPDEMVRHKILDLIGDLSLVGHFLAHVIVIRSGHTANVALGKALLAQLTHHKSNR